MGRQTVVVGMSGGVDSSVTALLLKQQGYDVIGLFMKNWEETDQFGKCRSSYDFQDVEQICHHLDIPYYTVNFVEEYKNLVFSSFIKDLEQGYTPNPDILCNREIKFNVFLKKALSLGADFLATGHYCQKALNEHGEYQLLKGFDGNKDQSYFLYTINSQILEKVLFPIGHLLKPDLRRIAEQHQLITFNKKDSTGICFIGERNFKQFLNGYLPYTPGNFETLEGEILGQHDGVAYYTIGQRKGMGIGGAGEPWFVVGKDVKRNVVFLSQGVTHPALYADSLTANELFWVSKQGLPSLPLQCKAKIRYRQEDQDCTIEAEKEGVINVRFHKPQRAITSRQAIVFYHENVCLGGGTILAPGPSYYEQKREIALTK